MGTVLRSRFLVRADATTIRRWAGVSVAFALPLLTNMRALKNLNVETAIVFRSFSTLVVAIMEVAFMNSTFSTPSVLSMLLTFIGSVLYGYYDIYFSQSGYFWGTMYCGALVFNGLYIKAVFNTVHSKSDAEKTYYNNLVTLPFFFTLMFCEESWAEWSLSFEQAGSVGLGALIASCFLGTAISYTGTVLRNLISATAFNIAGNANKFVTVFISMVLVEQNISKQKPIALLGLFLSLFGAGWYAYESKRTPAATVSMKANEATSSAKGPASAV